MRVDGGQYTADFILLLWLFCKVGIQHVAPNVIAKIKFVSNVHDVGFGRMLLLQYSTIYCEGMTESISNELLFLYHIGR